MTNALPAAPFVCLKSGSIIIVPHKSSSAVGKKTSKDEEFFIYRLRNDGFLVPIVALSTSLKALKMKKMAFHSQPDSLLGAISPEVVNS